MFTKFINMDLKPLFDEFITGYSKITNILKNENSVGNML